MRYIIYTIYIIIAIGINAGLFPALGIYGTIPSLILISCTIAAVTVENIHVGFFISMLGGLIWELYTGVFPGSFMISYALASLVVYTLSRKVFFIQDRVKYLPLFIVVFQAITLVWIMALNWYMLRLHWTVFDLEYAGIISRSFVGLVYNLVLLYPLYMLFSQVERLVEFFERKKHTI